MDTIKPIKGNFVWENGIPDSKVIFKKSKKGRFLVAFIPSNKK